MRLITSILKPVIIILLLASLIFIIPKAFNEEMSSNEYIVNSRGFEFFNGLTEEEIKKRFEEFHAGNTNSLNGEDSSSGTTSGSETLDLKPLKEGSLRARILQEQLNLVSKPIYGTSFGGHVLHSPTAMCTYVGTHGLHHALKDLGVNKEVNTGRVSTFVNYGGNKSYHDYIKTYAVEGEDLLSIKTFKNGGIDNVAGLPTLNYKYIQPGDWSITKTERTSHTRFVFYKTDKYLVTIEGDGWSPPSDKTRIGVIDEALKFYKDNKILDLGGRDTFSKYEHQTSLKSDENYVRFAVYDLDKEGKPVVNSKYNKHNLIIKLQDDDLK